MCPHLTWSWFLGKKSKFLLLDILAEGQPEAWRRIRLCFRVSLSGQKLGYKPTSLGSPGVGYRFFIYPSRAEP